MKECPYCHAKISDEASFCLYCMQELKERQSVEQKKAGGKKILFGVFISGGLLLAGLASALFFLFRSPSTPSAPVSNFLPSFESFRSAIRDA